MAGYSGTPLAKKLGLKPPLHVLLVGAPADYKTWLGDLPAGVSFSASARTKVQAAHLFLTKRALLEKHLSALRRQLEPDGFVWVSWQKKASRERRHGVPEDKKERQGVPEDRVATDITEDTIREVALPLGFVDIKVCAVSDVWSGLKLVIRKQERR